METTYSLDADKALKKMPPQHRKALIEKIERFAADPEGVHSFAKPLVNRPEIRIRQSDWRALVLVRPDEVFVSIIAHRKDVYRR